MQRIPATAVPLPNPTAVIVSLALLLRLSVVGIVLSYPRRWLFSKAPDLAMLAHSLSTGRGLSSPFGGQTGPTAFLAPGYPAILALLFHYFGNYTLAAGAALMLLQTLFSVMTVVLILHISRKLFGAPAARLAGSFWAVSPPLLWLPAIPWDTSLSALLLTGMFSFSLHSVEKPSRGKAVCMGAYCGAAMLVNPSLMPALFALAGWALYRTRARGRSAPLLCALVFLVVFVGWPIRNQAVFASFIPLRSNFGYELWQGNHPGGNGYFEPSLTPLDSPQQHALYVQQGEVGYMHGKTVLASEYIRTHPGEFVLLCLARAGRFWFGIDPEGGFGLIEGSASCTTLLGLPGLVWLWRRRRRVAVLFLLPLLLFPLPYYITHPDFRFRVLLDPLLTILAANLVVHVFSDRKGRVWFNPRRAIASSL